MEPGIDTALVVEGYDGWMVENGYFDWVAVPVLANRTDMSNPGAVPGPAVGTDFTRFSRVIRTELER